MITVGATKTFRFMSSGLESLVERTQRNCSRKISSPSWTGSAVFEVIGPAWAAPAPTMSIAQTSARSRLNMAQAPSGSVPDLDGAWREARVLDRLPDLLVAHAAGRRLERRAPPVEVHLYVFRAGQPAQLLLDAVGAEGAGHAVHAHLDVIDLG